jgi:hypothetical protein
MSLSLKLKTRRKNIVKRIEINRKTNIKYRKPKDKQSIITKSSKRQNSNPKAPK